MGKLLNVIGGGQGNQKITPIVYMFYSSILPTEGGPIVATQFGFIVAT